MDQHDRWLHWANELQSLAQAGIYYGSNVFDKERYERIQEIATEITAHMTDLPLEKARELFASDSGYLTPKLDTRAAIFDDDGRVLLVREASGMWALPGGWVDVDQSILENAVKEVREEAGLTVRADRLAAVLDRDKHNNPRYGRKIILCFVLCTVLGGQFQPNTETTESGYFSLDALPEPLALQKTTPEELRLCYEAWLDPAKPTFFD